MGHHAARRVGPVIALFRRPPKIRRRADGGFELAMADDEREVLAMVLRDLAAQIEADPHDPSLHRLEPPAYRDDPERDAAYRLLAGEELRSSRRAAIEAVVSSLGRDRLSEDELWSWMQALNAVRLVVGTRLDISDDDHSVRFRSAGDPRTEALWAIYDFTTYLQHEAIEALES